MAAITLGVGISYATGNVGNSFSFLSFGGARGSGNVKTETRELTAFKSIDSGGSIQVEVVSQKSQSVEVETDDNILPLIKTEIKNDTLYISSTERLAWVSPIKVRISMDKLEGLNLSGGSRVTASGVKSDKLDVDVSGGAKASVTGEVGELSANASGGARIDAAGLQSTTANVGTSGGARADVKVTDTLNANASGGSRISYSGSPSTVNKKVSGGASVKQN